jgi:restriction system protein
MTVPDYQTLMLPVLGLAAKGETDVRTCVDTLAQEFGLSTEERGELLPSGKQTTFSNRLHWAKTYLVKAGLLEITRRGHFRATPRGFAALSENRQRIDNTFLNQFAEFRAFRERSVVTDQAGELATISQIVPAMEKATPEERIEAAYEEITAELRSALLERITVGRPEFFEKLIIDLMMAMDYGGSGPEAGKRLGKSGDGGVDGLINEDVLGLDNIYLQAKR